MDIGRGLETSTVWGLRRAVFGGLTAVVLVSTLSGTAVESAPSRTTGEIAGKVTRVNGRPASLVTVAAFVPSADGWVESKKVATRADGTYRLRGLAPGKYRIGFWSGIRGDIQVFYPSSPYLASAGQVTVRVGKPTKHVDGKLRMLGRKVPTTSSLRARLATVERSLRKQRLAVQRTQRTIRQLDHDHRHYAKRKKLLVRKLDRQRDRRAQLVARSKSVRVRISALF